MRLFVYFLILVLTATATFAKSSRTKSKPITVIVKTPKIVRPQLPKDALQSNAPSVYIVQPGDSLWSIAERYLKKPWQWEQLLANNPHLTNPSRLHPGDKLILAASLDDKHPTLQVETNKAGVPGIRRSDPQPSVKTIPLTQIRNFLQHHLVVSKNELIREPYTQISHQTK